MRMLDRSAVTVVAFLATIVTVTAHAQAQSDEFGFLERWQLLSDEFRAGNLELGEQGLPPGHDTQMVKQTREGLFKVAIAPVHSPYPFNEIHDWRIRVTGADDAPVTGAKIAIYGGMPLHNHGYPTAPRITGEIEPGVYALEGVKFSMSGWWTLAMGIIDGDERDSVSFNLVVEP